MKDNFLEKTKVKKIGASVHHTHSITNLFGSYVVFVNLLEKQSFGKKIFEKKFLYIAQFIWSTKVSDTYFSVTILTFKARFISALLTLVHILM